METTKNKTREDDIKELCNQIINVTPKFFDNPNGPYTHTCPLCNEETFGGIDSTMSDIEHDQNCGYLIAKDLMTGF